MIHPLSLSLLGTARALLYSSLSLQQDLQDTIIAILSDPRMPAALRRSVAALLQPIAKNRKSRTEHRIES